MVADDSPPSRQTARSRAILQRLWRVLPGRPGTLRGVTSETDAIPAPQVRSLTRWGVPFHYGLPAVVALLGLLLLTAGGTIAVIGGWWLAVALPIAIGSFLRDPWFAAAPLAVWVLWLIVVAVAGGDSGVAQTPVAVALALAAAGAVVTRVAQYAIFPATAHDAWAPAVQRLTHPGEHAAAAASPDPSTEPPDPLDRPAPSSLTAGEDAGQMTVALDALEPIGTAEHDALDAATREAGAPEEAEATAEPEAEAAVAPDTAVAQAPPADQDEPDPLAEAAEAVAAAVAAASPDVPAGTPVAAPETKPAAQTAPPKVVHHELPLDADPAPLDEGGHVSEFTAISEDDLLAAAAADQAQPGSSDVG